MPWTKQQKSKAFHLPRLEWRGWAPGCPPPPPHPLGGVQQPHPAIVPAPPPQALPAPPPPPPTGPAPKTVGEWYVHQRPMGAFGKPSVSEYPVMVFQWPTLKATGARALALVLDIQPGNSLCAAATFTKIFGIGKDELMKCDAPDWAPERLSKSADVKPIHATWRRLIGF